MAIACATFGLILGGLIVSGSFSTPNGESCN
ncbi:hypothetical protein [Paraburkholderia hospita]|nr:hypothetical protein [Paraburkholderia hospita]